MQGSDKTLFFTVDGVTFALTAPAEYAEDTITRPQDFYRSGNGKSSRNRRWVVKLDFLGANAKVRPVGQEPDAAVISYFKGLPEEWHADLPTYRRLVYPDLWPGIDLVYDGTVNRLKYHFVVHPGADPDRIRLAYRSATDVAFNAAGQLEVTTPLAGFRDDIPMAYQEIDGERVLVKMAYALDSAVDIVRPYHFDLGNYDPEWPLILDPAALVYAGYIGGSGADWGVDVALDAAGKAYVVGSTASIETTFPIMVGPDLTYNGGTTDVFIAKVNSTGTDLIYAGYIGGAGRDAGVGIAVDSSGNAFISGSTESSEMTFPVTVGPDLSHNGGLDVFVAKVNATRTGLEFAGYIGGGSDDIGSGIAIDDAGRVSVVGWTESSEVTFPVLVGPGLTYNVSVDAFVARVEITGTSLIYAGYIGDDFGDEIIVKYCWTFQPA